MTNGNKPPILGHSVIFDPAAYEPRFGKIFWMAAMDWISPAVEGAAVDTLIGNGTTNIAFTSREQGLQ